MLIHSLSQSIQRALRSGCNYGALLAVPALLAGLPVSVLAQDANKDLIPHITHPSLRACKVVVASVQRRG